MPTGKASKSRYMPKMEPSLAVSLPLYAAAESQPVRMGSRYQPPPKSTLPTARTIR